MTSSRMEEEQQSHVTQNILDLTLEIICLLTGERCVVVKMASIEGLLQGLYPPQSGEQNPVTAPPPPTDRSNEKKILEVINQVIELLTGERRAASKGNRVVKREMLLQGGALEDSGNLEEHKAAMLSLTLLDGSWKRTRPERSPRPPYSWDSAQEEQMIHHYDQVPTPERCCRPLYCRDSAPEEHEISQHAQSWLLCSAGEEQPDMKEEAARAECRALEEIGVKVTIKQEDVSAAASPEPPGLLHVNKLPHERLGFSLAGKADEDISYDSSREDVSAHPGLPPAEGSPDPAIPEGSSLYSATRVSTGGHAIPVCSICGKGFTSRTAYNNHRRVHSENRPYSCLECGKSFKQKTHLATHQACHTRERSYSCADCGKSFQSKARYAVHQRYHEGEKIYPCPDCGKEYPDKSKLNRHRKQHTAEKPFACTECEYRGWFHSDLVLHFRTHTGEKPFVCPVCGKSFRRKFLLHRHQTKKH